MRITILTAAAALFVAGPVSASTIVQVLPAAQTLGDLTPFDINGAQFNPATGPLISVSGELTGTVTPSIFRSLPPFDPTTLATRWFVFTPSAVIPGPNAFSGNLPDQLGVVPVLGSSEGATWTGSPIPVDLTFTFGDPTEFLGTSLSTLLVEFGFRASTPDLTSNSGGASDHTTFSGNLTLTYTYGRVDAVPEPATLSMFAAAVGALGLLGWRRKRKQAA